MTQAFKEKANANGTTPTALITKWIEQYVVSDDSNDNNNNTESNDSDDSDRNKRNDFENRLENLEKEIEILKNLSRFPPRAILYPILR
jgi:hypothetical protein